MNIYDFCAKIKMKTTKMAQPSSPPTSLAFSPDVTSCLDFYVLSSRLINTSSHFHPHRPILSHARFLCHIQLFINRCVLILLYIDEEGEGGGT